MIQGHTGGYSRGDPPLPIPNREVKPANADGTALRRGRVGSRRLISGEAAKEHILGGFPFSFLRVWGGSPCPRFRYEAVWRLRVPVRPPFCMWWCGQPPAGGWPAVPAGVRLFNLSLQWKAAGLGGGAPHCPCAARGWISGRECVPLRCVQP